MIDHIDHIVLIVSDIEKSVEFYKRVNLQTTSWPLAKVVEHLWLELEE